MGRSGGSGEEAEIFYAPRLQSTAGLCLQQCPQPSCGVCQLMARSFPVSSSCPGAEEATEVFLSGHTRMSGLKGASGFSCSCLQSHETMLASFWWCRCTGMQVSGNTGVAQAENQDPLLVQFLFCRHCPLSLCCHLGLGTLVLIAFGRYSCGLFSSHSLQWLPVGWY